MSTDSVGQSSGQESHFTTKNGVYAPCARKERRQQEIRLIPIQAQHLASLFPRKSAVQSRLLQPTAQQGWRLLTLRDAKQSSACQHAMDGSQQ